MCHHVKLSLHRAKDHSGLSFKNLMSPLTINGQWRVFLLSTDHPLMVSRFLCDLLMYPWASTDGPLMIHWWSTNSQWTVSGQCTPARDEGRFFSPLSSLSIHWRSTDGPLTISGPSVDCLNSPPASTGRNQSVERFHETMHCIPIKQLLCTISIQFTVVSSWKNQHEWHEQCSASNIEQNIYVSWSEYPNIFMYFGKRLMHLLKLNKVENINE